MQLIKQRKNLEYRMLLAIVQNPHAEKPQALWDELNKQNTHTSRENDKLDTKGMELLKLKMGANPRIAIK